MLHGDDLRRRIRRSLERQQRVFLSSLILNPVENIPFADDILVAAGTLHGLYNSDKPRTRSERIETVHQFAGRRRMENDAQLIYSEWARALGAKAASLRALSGLHAHIVLTMSITSPGDTVLLLPVEAGGHVAAKAILRRLGLTVVEMATDFESRAVDVQATLEICSDARPAVLFVDRSEGLTVEDFTPLLAINAKVAIFDASQYLTNIICKDHPNPLQGGFDILVASVHKNFPGPQKALFATRELSPQWDRLLEGASTFVSNMHSHNTYAAGLALSRKQTLRRYSSQMLRLAVLLEEELASRGVPCVRRRPDALPTHHVWIQERSSERAYQTFERLERCRILTNYRLLPYGLGYGIRLGTSAAVRVGLRAKHVPELAELIAGIRTCGNRPSLRQATRRFIEGLHLTNE